MWESAFQPPLNRPQTLGHLWSHQPCLLPAGGENIKSINQHSGAHVELQRNPPPNTDPSLRIFTIRGAPQQIEVARHLIDEKVGVRTRAFPHLAYTSWICFWMSKVPAFPQNLVLPVPFHPCIMWGQPLLLSKESPRLRECQAPDAKREASGLTARASAVRAPAMFPTGIDELRERAFPQHCPRLPQASPWPPALQAAFIDSGFSFRHLKADKEREC